MRSSCLPSPYWGGQQHQWYDCLKHAIAFSHQFHAFWVFPCWASYLFILRSLLYNYLRQCWVDFSLLCFGFPAHSQNRKLFSSIEMLTVLADGYLPSLSHINLVMGADALQYHFFVLQLLWCKPNVSQCCSDGSLSSFTLSCHMSRNWAHLP